MLSGPCGASVTLAGRQWPEHFEDVAARHESDSSTPCAHATSLSPSDVSSPWAAKGSSRSLTCYWLASSSRRSASRPASRADRSIRALRWTARAPGMLVPMWPVIMPSASREMTGLVLAGGSTVNPWPRTSAKMRCREQRVRPRLAHAGFLLELCKLMAAVIRDDQKTLTGRSEPGGRQSGIELQARGALTLAGLLAPTDP